MNKAEAQRQALLSLMRSAKWEEAYELSRQMMNGGMVYWSDHTNYGMCSRYLGWKSEALDFFRRSLEANPAYEGALLSMANIHRQSREYRKAADLLTQGYALSPSTLEFLYFGSECDWFCGEYQSAAEKAALICAHLGEEHPEYHSFLARQIWWDLEQGNYIRAFERLKSSSESGVNNPWIQLNYARYFLLKGRDKARFSDFIPQFLDSMSKACQDDRLLRSWEQIWANALAIAPELSGGVPTQFMDVSQFVGFLNDWTEILKVQYADAQKRSKPFYGHTGIAVHRAVERAQFLQEKHLALYSQDWRVRARILGDQLDLNHKAYEDPCDEESFGRCTLVEICRDYQKLILKWVGE